MARIIINVRETRDNTGRKAVGVDAGYTVDSCDDIRVQNCCNDLYNIIADGFESGLKGGVVKMKGRIN